VAIQYAVSTRNAKLDAIETDIGTAPTLEIRSGSKPADCAAGDSGTLLCSMTLPSDWLGAAASGIKSKAGTWSGTASATGTAGHFRIKTPGGTCKIQGTVGEGTGDLALAETSITNGQVVNVTAFALTSGNA
jgi:hypothetical protein